MTKNNLIRICLILITLLVISENVYALGISPARRVINYEPEKLVSYDINILNSENKDQILAVYAAGDLSEYIELEKNIINLDKDQKSVTIRVNLKQPESFIPGTAKTNILVSSLPQDVGIKEDFDGEVFSGNLESNIGANIVVAHQLWVEVPYPGKYIKAKLRMQKQAGDPEFIVSLYSVGTEFIEEVSGRIEILGSTFEEIAEIPLNSLSIAPGKEGKISAVWKNPGISPGVYRARAVVQFDGETIVLEDNFYIGDLDIEIKDLTVNNFRLGTVAKINSLIESNWNSPLKEVYGEFDILRNGQVVSNFMTAPISIGPHAEETITGYWDTEGFEVGSYDILIKIHYEGKTSEKIFNAIVSLDEIKLSGGGTGLVTAEKEESSQLSLLVILTIALLGINVSLFIYIRRGKK